MLVQGGSVRQSLADATAAAHQDLHAHPWISRLARKDLQLPIYATVLGAYHVFFATIERQRKRIGVFEDLSLAPQISAMKHDLIKMDQQDSYVDMALPDNDPMAILGALYALHGAGFGAKTLRLNIQTILPDAPHQYFSLGTSPIVWRHLTAHLETAQARAVDKTALFEGAAQTFIRFGTFVSTFCEADVGFSPAFHTGLSGPKPRQQSRVVAT